MRIPLLAVAVAVAFLCITLSPPGGLAQSPGGSTTSLAPPIVFQGPWLVKGTVIESHTSIVVGAGITVASGGTLELDSVTLEMNESKNLAEGVVVRSGGTLIATNLTLRSSNPAYHTYLRESTGGMLRIDGGELEDLGGNSGGEFGVTIGTADSSITNVTFDHYYEAVHINGAANVTLSGITVLNSTAGNSTYAVSVTGGSDHFRLLNSRFDIPQDVGALNLNDPGAIVTGNVFDLDAQGTQIKPIDLGCSNDGLENASELLFANNTVTGAGVVQEAGSNVNISGNTIANTGPNRPYGILAGVPSGTAPGLWESGIDITHNHISNFSRYGIRLQLNVTDFRVSRNTVVDPSTHPGPAWTEDFGGIQIDGIYVIRGISDGSIDHNLIDLSDLPYIASNAILLESKVTNVRVVDNQVYNMTQNGVMVQGNVPGFVTNAPAWELGPSSDNLIANNLFDSMRYVDDDNFTYKGILIWLWSNYTTVENNTFIGFQNVDASGTSVNGAAIVCTGSENVFTNNTILGARYGFAFTKYASLPNEYSGESNRSDNLVYGNHLSEITVGAVYETPGDGMGPLDNVIDVLSNASGDGGPPASYLEAMTSVSRLAVQQTPGTFSQSLQTLNPLGGGIETFVTSLPWNWSGFNISVAGLFGEQYPTLTVDQANSTECPVPSLVIPGAPGARGGAAAHRRAVCGQLLGAHVDRQEQVDLPRGRPDGACDLRHHDFRLRHHRRDPPQLAEHGTPASPSAATSKQHDGAGARLVNLG